MTESMIVPIRWQDDAIELLDQRALPGKYETFYARDVTDTVEAIRSMVVRGAPAIGITAAYGVVLAAKSLGTSADWQPRLDEDVKLLATSRPTAVNLFWALERMKNVITRHIYATVVPTEALLEEALRIHRQDLQDNQAMARHGAQLIAETGNCEVMTHCNTGALATGGHGTALGVIRTAWGDGLISHVHVNETRPWLQGARLTAWELEQENIPLSLNIDSAASLIMKQGKTQWLIVGADRIAANGDVANKIGTFSLAVQARYHGIKVMVAAPLSTFDLTLATGDEIPIETRDATELRQSGERLVTSETIDIYNPVFDVTPAALIDAIVTEKGVIKAPSAKKIAMMFNTLAN
ncbi:S-methyl-5-thioribose-1-phosphate isomerase [Phytohalomonas tamaricis]|uniref:S-methyl-5-thioribose-1-phosphate isomerase n=1 Tax=Phytohalomonas tamaricis TaxID=2081032 RepID=UPI000D0ADB69|nr:S-methyl-5-thioribose-1-phosphate isomerase [Phytohalomonas tamaricis]